MLNLKSVFNSLLKRKLQINIYTPLPKDNDFNFDISVLTCFCRLKKQHANKIQFKNYAFDEKANVNIFLNYKKSVQSKIEIKKDFCFTKNMIYITFLYKNDKDMRDLISYYNRIMEYFLNPIH